MVQMVIFVVIWQPHTSTLFTFFSNLKMFHLIKSSFNRGFSKSIYTWIQDSNDHLQMFRYFFKTLTKGEQYENFATNVRAYNNDKVQMLRMPSFKVEPIIF